MGLHLLDSASDVLTFTSAKDGSSNGRVFSLWQIDVSPMLFKIFCSKQIDSSNAVSYLFLSNQIFSCDNPT